ncbi:MAG TPA: hypothetical protein P5246_00605 [Candidatus Omnitrophota bacterium]|nr:hypothetical protein [Candidatus Omnitrophota bacterium]HSA30215.1 hypothetical protein [Candidatus Omnitrophota bacterium]
MLSRKGQSVLEQSMIWVIIMAAILTIGVYFKRGIQGRWRAAIDDVGDQYDPYMADTNLVFGDRANVFTKILTMEDGSGYWTLREDYTNSTSTKTGYESFGSFIP